MKGQFLPYTVIIVIGSSNLYGSDKCRIGAAYQWDLLIRYIYVSYRWFIDTRYISINYHWKYEDNKWWFGVRLVLTKNHLANGMTPKNVGKKMWWPNEYYHRIQCRLCYIQNGNQHFSKPECVSHYLSIKYLVQNLKTWYRYIYIYIDEKDIKLPICASLDKYRSQWHR